MARLLVYGWYGHKNVGDELMAEALRSIFAGHELAFVDSLRKSDVEACDILLIGGGSFLYAPLNADKDAVAALASKPVAYVGVGIEGKVHEQHRTLLARAVGVYPRALPRNEPIDFRLDAVIPDLATALTIETPQHRPSRRLLFLPNAEALPHRSSPAWMRPAWDFFRSEACQAVDILVADGWSVVFAPFCDDVNVRDSWACSDLISNCERRASLAQLDPSWVGSGSLSDVARQFTASSVVVTQRFHGAVVSAIASVPCVVIHHHDKLAGAAAARHVPFYGMTKASFLDAVREAKTIAKIDNILTFEHLRDAVLKCLG